MLKSALTLDGKIAAPQDNTGWITSERARAHVQQLRHASDAMLTGIGTVLADDPQLNDRSGMPRARPLLRVVLDSTLRIPVESRLVRTAKDDVVIAATSAASPERRKALEARGVEVRTFDGPRGRVDLRDVIAMLAERRCLSVMIEAGSKVNWAALESGAVDKVFLYYAPKILGGHGIAAYGGRRRATAPHGRNSAGADHSSTDPAGRVRSRSLCAAGGLNVHRDYRRGRSRRSDGPI